MQAYTDLLNRSTNVANQPLQQYGGPLVQGFNDTQNQAFNNVAQTSAASQPYTSQAASMIAGSATPTLGQLPGATQSLMNPYMQSAVGSTAAQLSNIYGQQSNQLTGQAIGSGAYGGDRAGVAQAALANQQDLAAGQTISGMENTGYQQSQSAALNALSTDAWRQASAGTALGALGQQNNNALLQTGGMQQQLGQEQLNIPYEQFVQQQSYPFQTTGWLGNLVEGLGSQMGGQSQTIASGPNPISQVAGLGVAGLGAAGSAGAFQNRGGRIARAGGGPAASGSQGYLPDDVPDVSISYVPGGANSSSSRGAGPPAPPGAHTPGGAGSGLGVSDASLTGLAKAGKQIADKWSGSSGSNIAGQDEFGNYIDGDGNVVSLASGSSPAGAGENWDIGYAGAPATVDTAAAAGDTAAASSGAMDIAAIGAINRGGRIQRPTGGVVPSDVPDISTLGTDEMGQQGLGGGGGGAKGTTIPAMPKQLTSSAPSSGGGGSDQTLQDVMTAVEIAAMFANRGGRIARASGGVAADMPMNITIPNPSSIFASQPYRPAGYTPGAIATGGLGPESALVQQAPALAAPAPAPFDPGGGDPGNAGGGGVRRGGRIHYDAGGAAPDGSLAPPDMSELGANGPTMQAQDQRYSNLPADQLEALHANTPPNSPQGKQIAQALTAKHMLPSYAPPQQPPQQPVAGLMPGASAVQPQSSLGGPVSPTSWGTGFAGGGLVPTMRDGSIPLRDDYPEPHPWDEEEGNIGSQWVGHLGHTRPSREPGDWGMVRVPGYVGKDAETRSGDNTANRFETHPTRPKTRDVTEHAIGGLVPRRGYATDGAVGDDVDIASIANSPAEEHRPLDTGKWVGDRASELYHWAGRNLRPTPPAGVEHPASWSDARGQALDVALARERDKATPTKAALAPESMKATLAPEPTRATPTGGLGIPMLRGTGMDADPMSAPPPAPVVRERPIKMGRDPDEAPEPVGQQIIQGRDPDEGPAPTLAPPAAPPAVVPAKSPSVAPAAPPSGTAVARAGLGVGRPTARPTASAAPPVGDRPTGPVAAGDQAPPRSGTLDPAAAVQAAKDDRYKKLIDSLAYKEAPYVPPSSKDRDHMGNFWTALMSAGLGMTSGSSPSALSNLGEGGLRGIAQYGKLEQQDQTEAQSAKKLHEETEHWSKNFAHQQQESVRKAQADENKETADQRRADQVAKRDAITEERNRRSGDVADRRATASEMMAQAALARGSADHNQLLSGRGADENGNIVDGAYVFNPRTNKPEFHPGITLTGKAGGREGGSNEHLARGLMAEREDLRKTDPSLPPLTLMDATAIVRRAPNGSAETLRKESLAQSAARAILNANPRANFDSELVKYRKQYGLADAEPGAPTATAAKAVAPPITPQGGIDASKLVKGTPYTMPGRGVYYWDGEQFTTAAP